MEWVLRSPQIHSTFSNLGYAQGDGYHINENCNEALEKILNNILTEDKYLRTYRRSISFGQNIKKDLIPLLIHAKDDVTLELLIRILVNLTIPIECLLSVDLISKSDFGRHTIFEINNLLTSTKEAFTDLKATKSIIEYLKKNADLEQTSKLSPEQCTNITNSLILLRNILHIPEDTSGQTPTPHTVQNQILWNIFSQSIDKVLIKLMIIPDANKWAVTMVQLVALLYKDQHAVTLHKLLNLWLEASLTESSEDNESNTSPPDRDPTSDSSDTYASGKSNDEANAVNKGWDATSQSNTAGENGNQTFVAPSAKTGTGNKKVSVKNAKDKAVKSDDDKAMSCSSGVQSDNKSDQVSSSKNDKKNGISENSDCGYGTQIENQESISTSSNEDDLPAQKPVHQKPHNPKQRPNTKVRSATTLQDRKRRRIVKRGKCNIINVQGLTHKTPTDDDISNIMKEFTVDFLLKGYNSLVQTLHNQILTNMQLEIDTSHFFWLVTYFLKFATQIELDVEHVCSVLSFDIVAYLTAEGVNLCEQFELAIKLDGNDLKPNIRRLHLVVTAMREIIQAIEVYKKFSHICKDDLNVLNKLQIKMCDAEELRSLLVLLLRHYNTKYHTKQYLQDLVVTNHILLMFLDNVTKMPEYNGEGNILGHVRQFATSEIMHQYGVLLEDYLDNGEFVNDCIFTMMHHVGGELESVITLFQPKILKTFTSIWKSEFEICDDWSDLIEYVINTFVKKPSSLQSSVHIGLNMELFDDDKFPTRPGTTASFRHRIRNEKAKKRSAPSNEGKTSGEEWTDDEISSLSWNYMQCNALPDVVGEIIKMFEEDDVTKTRESVIRQLYKQNLISNEEYTSLLKGETDRNARTAQMNKESRENEISKLCEQLILDGKSDSLDWVQKVLLDACCARIYVDKQSKNSEKEDGLNKDFHVLSPVSYHSLVLKQSIPLVPWNCKQASICKDLKFLQLVNKLGLHMPVDSGKVFIRIPNFWTADFLYDVAGKVLPIDLTKLKFSVDDITEITNSKKDMLSADLTNDITMIESAENYYQIHKHTHMATLVNFTPMPGSSYGSELTNIDKLNWLEVVQKSQEYKISLSVGSKIIEMDMDTESEVIIEQTQIEKEISIPPLMMMNIPTPSSSTMGCGVPFPGASLVLPTIMSVKQDISHFDVPLADADHSVCETASVASDLTRMYVSDEDEKPEVLLRPVIDRTSRRIERMCEDPCEDVCEGVCEDPCEDDCEEVTSGKRPRIEFFSPF